MRQVVDYILSICLCVCCEPVDASRLMPAVLPLPPRQLPEPLALLEPLVAMAVLSAEVYNSHQGSTNTYGEYSEVMFAFVVRTVPRAVSVKNVQTC